MLTIIIQLSFSVSGTTINLTDYIDWNTLENVVVIYHKLFFCGDVTDSRKDMMPLRECVVTHHLGSRRER